MKSKQNPPGGRQGWVFGGLSVLSGLVLSHLPNLCSYGPIYRSSSRIQPLSRPRIYLEIQNFVFSRIYSVYSIITPADSGAVLYD